MNGWIMAILLKAVIQWWKQGVREEELELITFHENNKIITNFWVVINKKVSNIPKRDLTPKDKEEATMKC